MIINPDNAPEKQAAYKAKIAAMTDDELSKEMDLKIWLSAYANNNPRSCYHWQADATYSECKRRGKPELYTESYERQRESCS